MIETLPEISNRVLSPKGEIIPTRREFAREEVKAKEWSKQNEILDAIDNGAKKILIRSNNGAGKTNLLGIIAAYELKYANEVTVICSGATATQLKGNLYKEIKRKIHAAGIYLQCKISVLEISKDSTHKICFINPAKAESGQGYHAPRIVVMIDEATSLDAGIIQALLSNATGADSLVVMTYNPLSIEASIYEIEEQALNSEIGWNVFVLSAFDHPNVITGTEFVPGAVTRDFVETTLRINSVECDKNVPDAIYLPWNGSYWQPTPEALARVCGKWSHASSHGFIPGSMIIDCINNGKVSAGITVMGMDVASSGEDKTVWSIWKGSQQIAIETMKTGEFAILSDKTVELAIAHDVAAICIDDSGVGHAVTDRLGDYAKFTGIIIPVNFSQKPKGFEQLRKPLNARAEMYLSLERELRSRSIKPLYDQEQLKELASTKVQLSSQSESLRIEDKKLIKKRLGRSPDKADAMALARYGFRMIRYFNQPKLV